MRQFFIFLCFFSCASVLADHDSSGGWNYNGRTFYCDDYEENKRFSEKAKELAKTKRQEGALHYNWALCQLHRGPEELMAGIETFQKAAALGDHTSDLILEEYFISDGYELSKRKITKNQPNLQKAIEHLQSALRSIRNQSNYPNNPDDLNDEIKNRSYLNTAENLPKYYVRQFGLRITDHLNGIATTADIGNSTIKSLKNARDAAGDCLKIPGNTDLWSEKIHANAMARCREKQRIALALLPLEQDRLDIAQSSQCQKKTNLSECPGHNKIKKDMLQLYSKHIQIAKQQLATL